MTGHAVLPRRAAVIVFLAFAFAYFLSALVRAVTATLAPTLAQEFSLQASDLGLLAGGYFLGFAATQLPLGTWLDRHGPRKGALGFLGGAVVGSLVFSVATGFSGLLAGRVLCGAGVSACLMAPLTGYRRWFEPTAQMRANSWMLMTGSLGMVASTLPVQWALPLVGWRPLFWGLAALIALSMLGIGALLNASVHALLVLKLVGGAYLVWLGVQLWLATRQMRYVVQHRHAVPGVFATHVSLHAHQKAADYTLAKGRFGLLTMALGAAVLLGWTLLGGLDTLNSALLEHLLPALPEAWRDLGYQLALLGSFVLIGSGNPEEGDLRPQLLDRFGLSVDVRTIDDLDQRIEVIRRRDAYETDPAAFVRLWAKRDATIGRRVVAARKIIRQVEIPDHVVMRMSQLCLRLGIDGMRGELTLMRASRAAADWRRRVAGMSQCGKTLPRRSVRELSLSIRQEFAG